MKKTSARREYYSDWARENPDKVSKKQLAFFKKNKTAIMTAYKSKTKRPEQGWVVRSKEENTDLVLDIVRQRTGKNFKTYPDFMKWVKKTKTAISINY